ncbi:RNA-binding S4 domain-containing protein [Granulibacter bethesdensis]|uniref:RNA-binding S4 domain-containing protein n=1 Tax=Granulibacter bethesdensis TaxID=364410 RepID=UPI0009BE7F9E|nr:RNA-binding S4 domain-containing protein [Granulibacter bethesdensis]
MSGKPAFPNLSPHNSGSPQNWQRLDSWLWCARFLKSRSLCARLIEHGLIRLNGQPTDKPHARLRIGDVLVVPFGDQPQRQTVRVLRVLSLATRRGPASEARELYEDIPGSGVKAGNAASTPPSSPAMLPAESGIPPETDEN